MATKRTPTPGPRWAFILALHSIQIPDHAGDLAMSAASAATTATTESAASAAPVSTAAANESARISDTFTTANVAPAFVAASNIATPVAFTAVAITAAVAVAVAAAIVSAMEPRSRADEEPAVEPLRPVISIRSTGIRIVVIIAIRACRRTVDVPGSRIAVSGPHTNSHGNLRMGI